MNEQQEPVTPQNAPLEIAQKGTEYMTKNPLVKRYSVAAYVGMLLNHYAFERLTKAVGAQEDEETARKISEFVYMTMREESMRGQSLQELMNLLRGVERTVEADIKAHRKMLEAEAEEQRKQGFALPFGGISQKLAAVKPGQVLIFTGRDAAARSMAYELAIAHVNANNVPATKFALREEEPVMGLSRVSASWWTNAFANHSRTKDVFGSLQAPVLFVDDVCQLRKRVGRSDDAQRLRRLLGTVAKRKQLAIVGCADAEEFPFVGHSGPLYAVEVSCEESGGKCELFIEGKKWEAQSNESTDTGSRSGAGGELDGDPGRSEDGQPEGPGEDRG